MNRRGFLRTLAAAMAGATLDPERLFWVPGKKTIFLPDWSQPPAPALRLCFHPDAFALVMANLQFDVRRFDVLYGTSMVMGNKVNVRLPKRFSAHTVVD